MRMIVIHCNGSVFFCLRRPPHRAHPVTPCDARHALLVDHVALALDVRVSGRVAPCVAIPHVPHALEAHASHKVPFKHAFRVDPRAPLP